MHNESVCVGLLFLDELQEVFAVAAFDEGLGEGLELGGVVEVDHAIAGGDALQYEV